MLPKVVLVSAVLRSESALRIHISPLPWISFPFRFLHSIEFPVLYSRFSSVIYFIHSSVYIGENNGTHSSTLAWKIPWTEEPGRLQSMGSLRVGHD